MIHAFLMNLLLAAVYMALTSDVSFMNGVIGFAIGYFVLSIYGMASGRFNYAAKLFLLLRFALYFLRILVKANLEVAWEIITPGFHMKPRIIRYSVEGMTDVQITTLANAITLTPGTLTVDVDDERDEGKYLYIHCMYADDPDDAAAGIDELRHRLMRDVFGS